ncbi:hypothetical protein L917_06937, partial [Phytophthora nicotianae]
LRQALRVRSRARDLCHSPGVRVPASQHKDRRLRTRAVMKPPRPAKPAARPLHPRAMLAAQPRPLPVRPEARLQLRRARPAVTRPAATRPRRRQERRLPRRAAARLLFRARARAASFVFAETRWLDVPVSVCVL